MPRLLLVFALINLVTAATAAAHGVHAEPVYTGIGLRVQYDTGEPMAFADVKVFAPGQPEHAWMDGFTDPEGRFVFAPPAAGIWTIAIDDGMGHALTREISVDAETFVATHDWSGSGGKFWPAIAGIGLIFGCFGLWAMFRRQT